MGHFRNFGHFFKFWTLLKFQTFVLFGTFLKFGALMIFFKFGTFLQFGTILDIRDGTGRDGAGTSLLGCMKHAEYLWIFVLIIMFLSNFMPTYSLSCGRSGSNISSKRFPPKPKPLHQRWLTPMSSSEISPAMRKNGQKP